MSDTTNIEARNANLCTAVNRLILANEWDKAIEVMGLADSMAAVVLRAYRDHYQGPAEWLCADGPAEMAVEWAACGHTYSAYKWWDAGCFDCEAAAELRDVDLTPDAPYYTQLSPANVKLLGQRDDGIMWSYLHSNGDVSTENIIRLAKSDIVAS